MYKLNIRALSLALLAGTALTGAARADVTFVASQDALNSLGTISQNTNFDSYGSGWTYTATPLTIGELTFVAGQQALVGGVAAYGAERPLFTDDYVQGTYVNVAGSHNLFGMNAANFYGSGLMNVVVTTNLASYNFSMVISGPTPPLTFLGFESSFGEDILQIFYGGPNATGATDFQIGNAPQPHEGGDPVAGGVPEPASWLTMLLGFGVIGFAMRDRKRATVSFG